MDQLSAHLERGWDLAQRGDTAGASASARRALELDPEAPEVHNLLGFVAALDGDTDEALEAYTQAIDLDETYVEAMLNAAELLVHPIGDHREALRLCDLVLDVTDYPDEVVDALLLKFEALVAQGEVETAKRTLSRLPEGPYPNGSQNFLTARAHFEIGDLDRAASYLEASLEQDPTNSEAHYYAGLLAEKRGDSQSACAAFLRTRQLELEAGLPPWAPNPEAFLLFTQNALGGLADELKPFIEVAELYVADLPGPEVVVDGVDPRSTAMVDAAFIGPSDEQDTQSLAVVPEQVHIRIFLYALNIMRGAGSLHAVQQTIGEAVADELTQVLRTLESDLDQAVDLEAQSQR